MQKDTRTRNWELIVYPESAPDNWEKILDDMHLCWACSPLHDLDTKDDTGELKKAHYHVILSFAGKKSEEQIQEICSQVGNAQYTTVKNMRGAVRYMVHLDDPYKHPYNQSDIRCFGGFDISTFFNISNNERYDIIEEMRQWCRDNECLTFHDLFDYAAIHHRETWFRALCDNSSYVMSAYIQSLRSPYVSQSDHGGIV